MFWITYYCFWSWMSYLIFSFWFLMREFFLTCLSFLFFSSNSKRIGSNSLCEHMMQLKIEIWMAKLEQINDMMTVVSECETSVWIKKMNSKWIRYWGPSCVTKVQIPITRPKGCGLLQMSTLLSMQKESRTVATSICSLMNAMSQFLSIPGKVWLKFFSSFRNLNKLVSGYEM